MMRYRQYISLFMVMVFALTFVSQSVAAAIGCDCEKHHCCCCSGCGGCNDHICDDAICDDSLAHFDLDTECNHYLFASDVLLYLGESRDAVKGDAQSGEWLYLSRSQTFELCVGSSLVTYDSDFLRRRSDQLYLSSRSLRAPPVLS